MQKEGQYNFKDKKGQDIKISKGKKNRIFILKTVHI